MTEFDSTPERELLEAVRAEQNAIEENLREHFLMTHLFKDEHFAGSHYDELIQLKEEFVQEKRNKNMGERFNMALSEKYFDKIHVVELGLTEKPGLNGEVDGLKHEYTDLRHWLQLNGTIQDELPRQESGRTLQLRDSAAAPEHIVMIRNRPLIESTIDTPRGIARFGIAKRMVFSMPRQLCAAILRQSGGNQPGSEEFMQRVETILQQRSLYKQHTLLNPIRTGYYLASEKIDG